MRPFLVALFKWLAGLCALAGVTAFCALVTLIVERWFW